MPAELSNRVITISSFKVGTHEAMSGESRTYTDAEVQELATDYDGTNAPAPAVVGHPEIDAPAYGWIQSAKKVGDDLLLTVGSMTQQFVDWLDAKHYRKVSIALFRPDDPGNPKPGKWYIRHLGFLGATPPAVSGLPLALARQSGITYEFAVAATQPATVPSDIGSVASIHIHQELDEIKRALNQLVKFSVPNNVIEGDSFSMYGKQFTYLMGDRQLTPEMLAAQTGIDPAVLTTYLNSSADPTLGDAMKLAKELGVELTEMVMDEDFVEMAATGKEKESPAMMVGTDKEKDTPAMTAPTPALPSAAQFAALSASLEKQRKDLNGLYNIVASERAQLATERAAVQREGITAFAQTLVDEFKIRPEEKDRTIAAILATPDTGEIAFAGGKTLTARGVLKQSYATRQPYLNNQQVLAPGQAIQYGTVAMNGPSDMVADPDAAKLHQDCKTLMAKENISYSAALSKLQNVSYSS